MPIDLASVLFLPSNRRHFCFLSIALGLMVDLDIGTENMRWMGDTRFILGFIKGIVGKQNFRCRLKMKVVEKDKVEMARAAREAAKKDNRLLQGNAVAEPSSSGKMEHGVIRESPERREGDSAEGTGVSTDDAAETPMQEELWVDEGRLDWAEPLQPDDSWLVIDSTTTRPASKPHLSPEANTDGAWRNGDGMLYF
jgi:sphingosine kinase